MWIYSLVLYEMITQHVMTIVDMIRYMSMQRESFLLIVGYYHCQDSTIGIVDYL